MPEPHGGYHITDQHATYFLTFTTVGWIDLFTRLEIRNILIDSIRYCQQNKGLVVNAYVIMSNHIHIICRASNPEIGLSDIIRDFKKFTSKKIIEFVKTNSRESRSDWLEIVMQYHAKNNTNNIFYKLWQSSNHPMILIHPKFTRQKLNYIHNNPVTANIVELPEHYLYSSARDYVGLESTLLNIEIIDFGIEEGYVIVQV